MRPEDVFIIMGRITFEQGMTLEQFRKENLKLRKKVQEMTALAAGLERKLKEAEKPKKKRGSVQRTKRR